MKRGRSADAHVRHPRCDRSPGRGAQTRTHSRIFPEGSEVIWGTLSFLIVAFLLWKFAGPQIKKAMKARTEPDPDGARRRRPRRRPRPRPRRRGSARPRATSTPSGPRILAEADAQAERAARRRPGPARAGGRRAGGQGRAPTSPRPSGRSATSCAPRSPAVGRRGRPSVVAGSLDDATQQQLIEDFIAESEPHRERDMSDQPHRRLRHGAVRGRPGRGHARRGRGRAVPLRPHRRGQRRAAQRAHRPARSRPTGARRSSRTCSAARPRRPPTQLVSMVVGAGRGRDLPAIVDRLVERRRRARKHGGRRGPLGRRRSPTTSSTRLAAALEQRHRQAGRGQGRRRPVGPRRPRRHRSATPSSTAPSVTASTNSRVAL